jgi:23S rRNA (uracil1939-C5)-methyltransferase
MVTETLRIEALGNRVGGVAKPAGLPVTFVAGALPGELVECSITGAKAAFREASLVEVLEPSPQRVEPPCPWFGRCGGCSLQHLSYDGQVYWKAAWVSEALKRFLPGRAGSAVPSPLELGYRNRVTFEVAGGRPGLHRSRGDVIRVESCPLLCDTGAGVLRRLAGRSLDPCTQVTVRAGMATGDSMVEFSGGEPSLHVLEGLGGAGAWWRDPDSGWLHSAGPELMREVYAGVPYRLPPGCFTQVNTPLADALAMLVLEAAGSPGTLLDLYAGIGTFSIPAARRGAMVTAVEIDPQAAGAGRLAASESGTSGVEFVEADTGAWLEAGGGCGRTFDTVVCDPPRAGAGRIVCRRIAVLGAPRIVMVSCNPWTLARDVSFLAPEYRLVSATPVDLFPQTDHVETVAILESTGG